MKPNDHRTIQRLLDGEMSAADFAGFQQRLRQEPALARLYGEYATLNHSLCEEFGDVPVRSRPPRPVRRSPAARAGWLALAAVLALGAWIAWQFRLPPPAAAVAAAANLRFSADAVWVLEGRTDGPDHLGTGGTLRLIQGRAEFAPIAELGAVLDGPATLQVLAERSWHLSRGKGRFRMLEKGGRLEITTPSMVAEDLGTEFGVLVSDGAPDELHVFDGAVRMRINGKATGETLSAGEAGRVAGADGIERLAANGRLFPEEIGEFQAIVAPPFQPEHWRVGFGDPGITAGRIDGGNFAAFLQLPQAVPTSERRVLLVTLTTGEPAAGEFHTDGWAGLSLFSGGAEVVFFGDSFGPEKTWSLDVKQHIPVILPARPLVGPHTVTLRYDRTTGAVSLHEGGVPLRPAFCSGKLPPNLSFDQIRLGASSAAALAAESLTLQAGG